MSDKTIRWLKGIGRLQLDIELKEEERQKYIDRATNSSAELSDMPASQTNRVYDPISENMPSYVDSEDKVAADIKAMQLQLDEKKKKLRELECDDEYQVLYRKYVSKETTKEMEYSIGFTRQHINRIHKSAVRNLDEMLHNVPRCS